MVEGTKKLQERVGCLFFCEGTFDFALINELATCTELHAEVDEFIILIRLQVIDDISMINLLKHFNF